MTDVKRGRHCAARRPVTPLTIAARAASGKASAIGRGSALAVASSSLIVGSVLVPSGAVAETTPEAYDINVEAGEPAGSTPAVIVSDSVVWSDDVTTLKVKAPVVEDDEDEAEVVAAASVRTTTVSRSTQRTTLTEEDEDEASSSTAAKADSDKQESSDKSADKSDKSQTKSAAKKSAKDAVNMDDAEERGAAIVAIAKRYIGVPYVSGGSTPAGFDCSGFTSYVYAKLGIELPRTSGAQRYAGTVVSASKALPGDIVWSPGHVAIYLGNGQIIDAPRPGKSVQIRAMYQSNPVFIRISG